jgi:hypothetical protein
LEDGKLANYHWNGVLENYERETDNFKRYIHDLEASGASQY